MNSLFLGYNLYDDTKPIAVGQVVVVDGESYEGDVNPAGREPNYTANKCENREGYLPKDVKLFNSGYMADYADPTIAQIQRWVDQKVLINVKHFPEYDRHLGEYRAELKLTIEPSKPRLW